MEASSGADPFLKVVPPQAVINGEKGAGNPAADRKKKESAYSFIEGGN